MLGKGLYVQAILTKIIIDHSSKFNNLTIYGNKSSFSWYFTIFQEAGLNKVKP
jgi:hypothetical protein